MALSAKHRRSLRVGICAGEASGDALGAGLITALRAHVDELHVSGVCGPDMMAAGVSHLFAMEELAVMGVSDVLLRLPAIWRLRRQLIHHFSQDPPDVFIGIDAPDFNLGLERALKKRGIKTMHYVSPTVWAWRKGRLKTIAAASDAVLTLFPFEAAFYQAHNIPVHYVGHPLADAIAIDVDQAKAKQQAREQLSLMQGGKIIALLPGSRTMEIKQLGPVFLQAASFVKTRCPDADFICPLVSQAHVDYFKQLMREYASDLTISVVLGQTQQAITASDVVLSASGTVTLETMLLKRPMVVAYKMSALNWWIARCLVSLRYCSLPNLLADTMLVPEFLQEAATGDALGQAVLDSLHDPSKAEQLSAEFTAIHQQLRCGASSKAAQALLEVVSK